MQSSSLSTASESVPAKHPSAAKSDSQATRQSRGWEQPGACHPEQRSAPTLLQQLCDPLLHTSDGADGREAASTVETADLVREIAIAGWLLTKLRCELFVDGVD